jgi:hypothetical protein
VTAEAGRRFSARLVARSARRRTGRGPLETGRLTGTGIRKPGGYGVTNAADTTPWPTPRPGRYQPDEVHRRGKEMALVPAAMASSRLGRRRPEPLELGRQHVCSHSRAGYRGRSSTARRTSVSATFPPRLSPAGRPNCSPATRRSRDVGELAAVVTEHRARGAAPEPGSLRVSTQHVMSPRCTVLVWRSLSWRICAGPGTCWIASTRDHWTSR